MKTSSLFYRSSSVLSRTDSLKIFFDNTTTMLLTAAIAITYTIRPAGMPVWYLLQAEARCGTG